VCLHSLHQNELLFIVTVAFCFVCFFENQLKMPYMCMSCKPNNSAFISKCWRNGQ